MEIRSQNWAAIPFDMMRADRPDAYTDVYPEFHKRNLQLTGVHMYYFLLGATIAYELRRDEGAELLIIDYDHLPVQEVDHAYEVTVAAMRGALSRMLNFIEVMPEMLPGFTDLNGLAMCGFTDEERCTIHTHPVTEAEWITLKPSVVGARAAFVENCQEDEGYLQGARIAWAETVNEVWHEAEADGQGEDYKSLDTKQLEFIAYCMLHGAECLTAYAEHTLRRMQIDGLALELVVGALRSLVLIWDEHIPSAPMLPSLSLHDLVGRAN